MRSDLAAIVGIGTVQRDDEPNFGTIENETRPSLAATGMLHTRTGRSLAAM